MKLLIVPKVPLLIEKVYGDTPPTGVTFIPPLQFVPVVLAFGEVINVRFKVELAQGLLGESIVAVKFFTHPRLSLT
jgi:hypothetical protein